jgi:hypothetical protein
VQDDPQESWPTEEFLGTECPDSVRADLIAIIDAVAASPPPQLTGGGMWEAMRGTMSGFYEARRRGPGRRLHRQFCLMERDGPGLNGQFIIVVAGLSKAHRYCTQCSGLRAHHGARRGISPAGSPARPSRFGL